ncbi:hypothetical protein ACQKOF_04210 [Lysinibacillus sp. NPDC093190]|uniref:hypothetical protein n=1 Tax=Lysinibacillus sp. NPDC093190 TaxID=3390575 RepID=UPI003D07C482
MTIGKIIEELGQGKALADIGKELTVGKEKLSKVKRLKMLIIYLIDELDGRMPEQIPNR